MSWEESEDAAASMFSKGSYSSGHQFDVPTTKSVLDVAKEIIYGDREQTYGDPGKNLRTVAYFWENYLEARGHWDSNSCGLTAEDVCHMMSLLKIARLANTPSHHDSLVDLCGYTALVERCNAGRKTEEGADPSTA